MRARPPREITTAEAVSSSFQDVTTMPNERSFGPRPSILFLCLPHLLEHQARRIPDAPAILAPGRTPLTYGRLYQHFEEMERRLPTMGIGRHDRIVIVLPNGPELAVSVSPARTNAQSVAISEACLKTTVETGLAGCACKTRTQKCRGKLSL